MLCHGPVRVPSDAQPGEAIVRVRMKDGSKFASFTSDIPVEIGER